MTKYAIDSEFKLDLVEEILASKEMYIGRYYFKKEKWIPAINRFRTVVDDYDKTIYGHIKKLCTQKLTTDGKFKPLVPEPDL